MRASSALDRGLEHRHRGRNRVPRGVILASLVASGCGFTEPLPQETAQLGTAQQALQLDPEFEPDVPGVHAAPATDYTLFEADPVRPIAVLDKCGLVAVANTFDDTVELLKPVSGGVRHCGFVKVGLRPVSLAVVNQGPRDAVLWVVNHVSDSISVVSLDAESCEGQVVDTLYTGDEPRDIVVADTRSGKRRVFVTAAHRGQHHPVAGARSASDLVTPAQDKVNAGLADVFVFDPNKTAQPLAVVNLFTDTPRALAVGDGVVYAAGYRTGNRTSVVPAERAAERGRNRLSTLLVKDAAGRFIEQGGELVLSDAARGQARMEGGMPAVSGSGRCVPDPRPEFGERFLQQLCVETDSAQRVSRVLVQKEGVVQAGCQCTSGDGTLQPTTAVVVKFFDQPADCGQDYATLLDGTRGCWLDASPAGVRTPATRSSEQAPPMAWNGDVKLTLPDKDVFAIAVDDLRVTKSFSGVGTVLFGMAVQPATGRLFVTGTEAQNLTHFEGEGGHSSSSVIGHLHESRVTVIDPKRGQVQPVHLNSHIDYGRCCARLPGENEKSFAFPTAGVFSPDGEDFFFSALGSDKVGIVKSRWLKAGFDNAAARRQHALREVAFGDGVVAPSGPVGLSLDARKNRLYVKTHFTNELVVIDTQKEQIIDRVALNNPEPESIRAGRHVLYNARLTSSHGDSACFSCHLFADLDGLSWDLGNPDLATVKNPGPFAVGTELVALPGIARDPLGKEFPNRPRNPDFRSNKGPMNTQTLRGLANHGAQHWRGDRTRRFQSTTGHQPNFGSLDENNSFNEFDVAIAGLNGNDRPLDPALFQAFTDFALQLTQPPNPIRALDNSLTPGQAEARALYFGCGSMSDEEFEQRQCIGLDGSLVEVNSETQNCECVANPLVGLLRNVPAIQGAGRILQLLFSDPQLRAAFAAIAADATGLPEAGAARVARLAAAASASVDGLLVTDLTPGDKGLFSRPAAEALSGVSGSILGLVQLSAANGTSTGGALLTLLSSSIPPNRVPPNSPLLTPSGFRAVLTSMFSVSNLSLRTLIDEQARGTSDFHNMLQGCDPSAPVPLCRLRVTDSFTTCNGCHTLDPDGNREFDVYRPGFFGTSGSYSFENESQVMKVPHLRNVYQKAGMFGMPQVAFNAPQSVLGPRKGGFFAQDTNFEGEQVRGFGFMHDGSGDTLHRFHGSAAFVARPAGSISPNDPGNPNGLDLVFPKQSQLASCVTRFRSATAAELAASGAAGRPGIELCAASSPVPEACFVDPGAPGCREVLAALALELQQPTFAATFTASIRPQCFQLGSMLENGASDGVCAPHGLKEREDMEAFMLAFDSNLKPVVGQQVTRRVGSYDDASLRLLLAAAKRGDCDLALQQADRGFLVAAPSLTAPEQSLILTARARSIRLRDLKAAAGPVTFTCYPPQPDQSEAKRAAFASRPRDTK